MQDRAYILNRSYDGPAAEAPGYYTVAVPVSAVPIGTILAVVNAVIQYGPQLLAAIKALIAAFTPVVPTPTPTPVPPGPVPTPTPGPIPSI